MDPYLLLASVSLALIGCLAIKSASEKRLIADGLDPGTFWKRQVIFLAVAGGLGVAILLFDYRQLKSLALPIYAGIVLLLVVVMTPLGHRTLGAQRWINLGAWRIQPSELMKMGLIILLAAMLGKERPNPPGLSDVLKAVGTVMVPALMVFLQPDLGTVMVMLSLLFAILLVSGTRVRWLALIVGTGIVALLLALQLGVLHEYQVARLTAFLESDSDSSAAQYNLDQSKIAIGSGGLDGNEHFDRSQTNLAYVPEQHTDFIFTAIGEQRGFVGSLVVVGLFGLLLWRCLRISMLSKDMFGTLLAAGIAAMFGFQVFVNIGMTIGIMPITGIPLPFVSYGGSSLLTGFAAVGVLMNIHMRRFL